MLFYYSSVGKGGKSFNFREKFLIFSKSLQQLSIFITLNIQTTLLEDIMDERVLVKDARGGDKDAFARLYTLYKDRLYRYAYYKLGDGQDAADAVEDCVLEAFKYIRTLNRSKAFSAWIFKILYRCCSRKIEEQIKRRESEEITEVTASYKQDFSSPELSEALDLLSDEDRDIVLLSVVAGYTSAEIASVMKLKPPTVRSKLSRALAKMRDFLQPITE